MERKNKAYIKFKLAACIRKIISDNKAMYSRNREKGIEDLSLIDTVRQLEAASGLSYNLIQGVAAGKRDPQFTSLITLIESMGISLGKFASLYDKVTDADIQATIKQIDENRKKYTRVKVKTKKQSRPGKPRI
jgi:hypothetical protein